MNDLTGSLYISTISDDAEKIAFDYGLGLEIAEFCTAFNMDTEFEKWDSQVREKMRGVGCFTFHAPFNELCPAAIDPLIVEVAKKRYVQAYNLMLGYGINSMIAHTGFIPLVYHECWFVEKSVAFWREFLVGKPDDFRLLLENMLEETPQAMCEIACEINDDRFRLCLDIGHAAVVGKGISVAEWVERTLPYVGHVHIHNNYGEIDTHNALGDGTIDVRAVIKRIAEAVPAATFTIESRDGRASVEWLKANGFL